MGAPGAGQATTARGFVLTAPETLAVVRHRLPPLRPGWARLRFLYCGLCGSDLNQFRGTDSASYPASVGHEFVAEVVETGPGVESVSRGDLVTSDLNFRCGECDHCRAGRSHLCRTGQRDMFTNRAFSELGDIDAGYLLRLEAPAAPHLALCEPLSCVLHAQDLADPGPGERILLVGAGGLGLCLAFALCAQEPGIDFELTDLLPERLDAIAKAIQPRGRAVATPAGEYDVVFDLTGSEGGLRAASGWVRAGGRLCSMGHPLGEEINPAFLVDVLPKDVTFITSYLNGEPSVLGRAARMLESAWSPRWDPLIELLPLSRLEQAYRARPESARCKTVIDVAAGLEP